MHPACKVLVEMTLLRVLTRRSILWIAPAVILPLGALIFMQYDVLRKLEDMTADAQRERMQRVLEEVAYEFETYYRSKSESALTAASHHIGSPSLAAHKFSEGQIGGAGTFFVTTFHDDGIQDDQYFSPDGSSMAHVDSATKQAVVLATASWRALHRHDAQAPVPTVVVEEKEKSHPIVLRPVVDASTWKLAGVVGYVLDPRAARASVLSPMIQSTIARRTPADDENPISVRVVERRASLATAQAQLRRGEATLSRNLGFVLTDWRVTARSACASPEQIAASNFRINMLWTGGVSFFLIGSLGFALKTAAKEMRLSRMKSDFVSNVSHELRTPLSSIRVFGEYMRLGRVTQPEKIREYGQYIETEGRRLTALINNILDFSRIESMQKKYDLRRCDFAALVREITASMQTSLQKDGFTLTQSIAPSLPSAMIDPDAMSQVIVNLIDNAVKYSGEARTVEVSLAPRDGQLALSVRDFGIGIHGKEQKKIFDKFYRVSTCLVHDVKGSGLGLAIVRHVIEAHRGTVEVTSRPGEGSTFTVILPAPATETSTERPVPSHRSNPNLGVTS